MVSKDLLDILRCPACVREKEGLLKLYKDTWLVCQDCGRKYPVVEDIPVMLIDEGDKWGQHQERRPAHSRLPDRNPNLLSDTSFAVSFTTLRRMYLIL